MEPGPTIVIDDTQFQSAFRQHLAETERELPVAVNTTMFYIARAAHRMTPESDRGKIEKVLGIADYKMRRSRKTGKLKRGKAILSTRRAKLVYMIVNARLRRAGKKAIAGAEMGVAAAKLVGKRLSGIGTEKDGWLRAIRTLGAAIGQQGTRDGGAARIKGKSIAVLAKDGFTPYAVLEYLVNSRDGKTGQMIMDPRTVAALQAAFDGEAEKIRERLLRRMQPLADKIKGRP